MARVRLSTPWKCAALCCLGHRGRRRAHPLLGGVHGLATEAINALAEASLRQAVVHLQAAPLPPRRAASASAYSLTAPPHRTVGTGFELKLQSANPSEPPPSDEPLEGNAGLNPRVVATHNGSDGSVPAFPVRCVLIQPRVTQHRLTGWRAGVGDVEGVRWDRVPLTREPLTAPVDNVVQPCVVQRTYPSSASG